MRTLTRFGIASAALTAGLALTGGSQAKAGTTIDGALNASYSRVSVRVGHPRFRVGAYVPRGYRITFRPSFGYGFTYRNTWIPVRRYQSSWRVCERPYVAYGGYGRYDHRDRYDDRYNGGHRCDDRCDHRDRSDSRYDRRDDNRDRYDDRDDRYNGNDWND